MGVTKDYRWYISADTRIYGHTIQYICIIWPKLSKPIFVHTNT